MSIDECLWQEAEPHQVRGYVGCSQQGHRCKNACPVAFTSQHHLLWVLDMDLKDLMFTLLGFGLVFILFLLSMPLSFSLEWECLLCATAYWKNITCFLNLQRLTAKRLL